MYTRLANIPKYTHSHTYYKKFTQRLTLYITKHKKCIFPVGLNNSDCNKSRKHFSHQLIIKVQTKFCAIETHV